MGTPPRSDVVAVLTHEHREVEGLFAELDKPGTAGTRERKDLVDRLTVELVRHSVAEEQYLYPAVRRHVPGGDAIAERELREHAEAEYLMKVLGDQQPADPGFEPTLTRLMAGVRAHVEEEERELFPRLVAECPSEQLMELGEQVAAAEELWPEWPSPDAPETLPTDRLLTPGPGLTDRLRNLLAHRGAAR